ncbi:MAG: magnetochrome domain-containing protein [Rhodospirillales bacterium]|nr:magnetochrome domain-containing protein [Rhodospirillales bacterium]
MAFGIVFSLAVFLGAVFDVNPWKDHSYENVPPITDGAPAPHADGKEKMACGTCHVILPPENAVGEMRLPIIVGTPSPHGGARDQQPCTDCHTVVDKRQGVQETVQSPKPMQMVTVAMSRASRIPPITDGAPSPHRGERNRQPCDSCHTVVNKRPGPPTAPSQMVTVAMRTASPKPPRPQMLGREAHETFMHVRFQGKVRKVYQDASSLAARNVTALVDNGVSAPFWIDLAPYWFLQREECLVGPGMFVKGTAFRQNAGDPKELAYAMNIAVNGELCMLRDSHMIGFWQPGAEREGEEE